MRPDLARETWTGWGVFAGVALVAGAAMYWFADDDGLAAKLTSAHSAYVGLGGPEPFSEVIAQQRAANLALRRTIDDRKRDTGFTVLRDFRIEPGDLTPGSGITPGYIFKQRFTAVREEIRSLAQPRSVAYEENLGFDGNGDVPADKDVPYLLTMLQLTQKACRITLSSNVKPVTFFSITHDKATLTGPDGRPPLIQEYPLTLTVHGDLVDVLRILFLFSQTNQQDSTHDYPLVLQGLDITGGNAKPIDQIQDVNAVFHIAGMRYLTDDERVKGTGPGFPMKLNAGANPGVPPAAVPTAGAPTPARPGGFNDAIKARP
jgi:hypothetical protein